MALIVDVQYREQYGSAALNRKLAGVLEPGIYHGFVLSPGGGLAVEVGAGEDPDTPVSTAVVERGEYSLTVRLDAPERLELPAPGTWFAVLEVTYSIGLDTQARLKLTTTPADHHVVLGCVVLPEGATAVTPEMITEKGRMEAGAALRELRILTHLTRLTTGQINTNTRLADLERWARANGYGAEAIPPTNRSTP